MYIDFISQYVKIIYQQNIILEQKIYVVRQGDSLSKIAKMNKTSVEEILKLNNIKDQNKIFPGQKINLPSSKIESSNKNNQYIIKQGDVLSKIAKKYNVSIDSIISLNKIQNPNKIYPGQKILIPSKNQSDAKNIKQTTPNKNSSKLSNQEYFVARVIYSQSSNIATQEEIKLICSVIKNRIGQKDFGNKKIAANNAYEVVKYKSQFSCVEDKSNSNWANFKPNLNKRTIQACKYAKILMNNPEKIDNNKNIVYYHDKTIEMPKNWDNKYYKTNLQFETQHFKFYSVIKNDKGK